MIIHKVEIDFVVWNCFLPVKVDWRLFFVVQGTIFWIHTIPVFADLRIVDRISEISYHAFLLIISHLSFFCVVTFFDLRLSSRFFLFDLSFIFRLIFFALSLRLSSRLYFFGLWLSFRFISCFFDLWFSLRFVFFFKLWLNFLNAFWDKEQGRPVLDEEIGDAIRLTRDGAVVHPKLAS